MASNIGEASSTFAIKLFSDLNVNSSNILFAPWSMFNALAMTFAGARGDTAHQMSNVLGLENPDSFQEMLRILTQLQGLKSVKSANKIWMQSNFKILPEFQRCVKTFFLSEAGEADYVKNSEGARKEINSWVEGQTKSKITDLIPSGAIDAMTRLVLVSAVYFKESWLTQFPKENTEPMKFHVNKNKSVTVQMMFMSAKKDVMYDEGKSFQVLSLPYIGGRLSMNIILPKKGIGLDEILNDLKSKESMIMSKFTNPFIYPEDIEIYIPRFKFDYAQTYNGVLQNHGCTDMFDDVLADFSGLSTEKPGLKVTSVIQKAFIEVNEEGTEAAAATAVVFGLNCAMPMKRKPIVFKADRPFIFIIFEKKANIILFMGKVIDPSK